MLSTPSTPKNMEKIQPMVGAPFSRRERSMVLVFLGIVMMILVVRRENSSLTKSVLSEIQGGNDETSRIAVPAVAVLEQQPKQLHASSPPPKSSGTYCTHAALNVSWYKSQDKEDVQLLTWFGNLCGGRYIEMGGLDGVLFSNSHVFNKGLNWTGVLGEFIKALVLLGSSDADASCMEALLGRNSNNTISDPLSFARFAKLTTSLTRPTLSIIILLFS
jgi:hypothetical protein